MSYSYLGWLGLAIIECVSNLLKLEHRFHNRNAIIIMFFLFLFFFFSPPFDIHIAHQLSVSRCPQLRVNKRPCLFFVLFCSIRSCSFVYIVLAWQRCGICCIRVVVLDIWNLLIVITFCVYMYKIRKRQENHWSSDTYFTLERKNMSIDKRSYY